MRCAQCGQENPEGAASCTSCSADLTQTQQPAAAEPAPAAAPPKRLRLSRFAVASLVFALLVLPAMALRDQSLGRLAPFNRDLLYVYLMVVDYLAQVVQILAVVTGVAAFAQTLYRHRELYGTALAIGGLAGATFTIFTANFAAVVTVAVAAVVIEIVLAISRLTVAEAIALPAESQGKPPAPGG